MNLLLSIKGRDQRLQVTPNTPICHLNHIINKLLLL